MLLITSETSDAIGSITEISDKKFRLSNAWFVYTSNKKGSDRLNDLALKLLKTLSLAVWIFDIVMIILMISFLYLYR